MSQGQLRTVHVDPTQNRGIVSGGEPDDIRIAAVGAFGRGPAGRSVQETLRASGIALPTSRQTLRVNDENTQDLNRILQPGDIVTIVDKVVGG